jgi:hypothetical protein
MDAPRKHLTHNPTLSFTMKRDEYKKSEDLRLVKHFASWLSKVGERSVQEETFEEDLLDGVCLCKLVSKINGSGMTSFHVVSASSVTSLDSFKAKENLVQFQKATKNLDLPISFGTEDLEKKNITRVISTLVFLAHVAHSQGVTVQDMDKEILEKVEEMDNAIEQQIATSQVSWFQQLLGRLGLEEWISFLSVDALKAYFATMKKNIGDKVEEQKLMARQRSQKLQETIHEKTASWKEALPDSIKTRIIAN